MLPTVWNLTICLAASVVAPMVVLVLCIVAGIGTVLLLPGRREPAIRKIGGVILLACLLVFGAMLVRSAASSTTGDVYFWVFSGIAVVAAIRVVSHTKPVYSALYFVLTVVASAGLFVLLWAEFMAAALVLIYAGAILVTYVFVIMLAAHAGTSQPGIEPIEAEHDRISREPVFAAAVGFAMMGVVLFLIFDKADGIKSAGQTADTTVRGLGACLFRTQLVSLELGAIILTVAMVGAVIIARRPVAGETPLYEDALAAKPGVQERVTAPATPVDDNPHTIPVYGTRNPQAKAYPES